MFLTPQVVDKRLFAIIQINGFERFLRSTKENASLISFLRPVSFELVCLCTAMQDFSRLL